MNQAHICINDTSIKEVHGTESGFSKPFGKFEVFSILLNDKNTKTIHIPDGTTIIEESLRFASPEFRSQTIPLECVTIPASVTRIKDSAFSCCSELKSVIFRGIDDNSPKAEDGEIGNGAFALCAISGTLHIPGRFKRIGKSAFSSNSFETVVLQEGTTHIESYVFDHCKLLKRVYIPRSVVSIKDSAFIRIQCDIYGFEGSYAQQFAAKRGMRFVKVVDADWPVAEPKGVTIPKIVESQYDRGTIRIPDGTINVDKFTFFRIKNELQKLIIPPSVNKIGISTFAGCERLESVIFLDNGENDVGADECEIDMLAFSGCGISGTLFIPGRFKSIGSNAFEETQLETVVFQEGVADIGSEAFLNCKSLKRAYIPRSVKEIQILYGSFDGCKCTIFGFKGSYAEQYVKQLVQLEKEECPIDFVAIDDTDWPEA